MKFHGVGTGTSAESNGDTALQTELTTERVQIGSIPSSPYRGVPKSHRLR